MYMFSSSELVLEEILRWLKFEQQKGEMEEVTSLDNSKAREYVSN